jgi:hypothetical protein
LPRPVFGRFLKRETDIEPMTYPRLWLDEEPNLSVIRFAFDDEEEDLDEDEWDKDDDWDDDDEDEDEDEDWEDKDEDEWDEWDEDDDELDSRRAGPPVWNRRAA